MSGPEKERWQEIQDEFYADPEKHQHLAFDEHSVYARDLTDHMVRGVPIGASDRVLEVGAGAGRFSLHFAHRCGALVALDTSEPLLTALKRESPPGLNLQVHCASVFDLPGDLGMHSVDVVCGFFILHHLPDHGRLFDLIGKSLRPGGRIGFLEPNRINPSFLVQVMVSREMTWKAEKGMFTFSATRTRKILRETGYADIRMERFGFFPPPILDRIPGLLSVQRGIERLAPLRRFLPFVLITARKR